MENPESSHFWQFPDGRVIIEEHELIKVDFHACMFGSTRDKKTRLVTNRKEFLELSVKCDGSHTHEGWGFVRNHTKKWKWATKLECEYPPELCAAVARVATKISEISPLPTPAPRRTRKVPSQDLRLAQVRADAGRQTRKDHRTNIPERKPRCNLKITSDQPTSLVPGAVKHDVRVGDQTIPKGSCVATVAQTKMGKHGCDKWKINVEVDTAWTTEEFLGESEKVVLSGELSPLSPTDP